MAPPSYNLPPRRGRTDERSRSFANGTAGGYNRPRPSATRHHDGFALWPSAHGEFNRGQVEELLTRYGKIDLIWFDGGPPAITIGRIRELQPGIVINPRMHGRGDFQTPEVHFPKERPKGWWELCAIWDSGGWGYTAKENYRSTASVLAEFVRVRAWGGNYLWR